MAAVLAFHALPLGADAPHESTKTFELEDADVSLDECEGCQAVQDALFGATSSDEEEESACRAVRHAVAQGGFQHVGVDASVNGAMEDDCSTAAQQRAPQPKASGSEGSTAGGLKRAGTLVQPTIDRAFSASNPRASQAPSKPPKQAPLPRSGAPPAAAAAAAQQQQQAGAASGAAAAAAAEAPAAPASAGAAVPLPARRCVLVAKCLTNSDASSGRIILPRVAVETNLPFVLGYRHYALAVKDCRGQRYEFMIKSWANGTEHRRVFVLEQAADFLRAHGVGVGDAVGICSDEKGELVVEANTPEVRQATVCPKYGALPAATAAHHVLQPAAGAAVPLVLGAAARCARSVHCTKPAGHPGFCSGPKAAAAAAAAAAVARGARGREAAAAARSLRCAPVHALAQPPVAPAPAAAAAMDCGDGSCSDEEAATAATLRGIGGSSSGGSSPSASAAGRQYASSLRPVLPMAAAKAAAAEAAAPQLQQLLAGLHPLAQIPVGIHLSKVLTSYDLSSKHVVMPAPEVEAGLGNALDCDLMTLAAVDESQGWQLMTLRAWTNLAHRRGYLLEGSAHGFLVNRGAAPGDSLIVYRPSELSPPRVEIRSGRGRASVRQPARRDAALSFAAQPDLYPLEEDGLEGDGGEGSPRSGDAGSVGGGYQHLVCRRTSGCTKHAGHQGFCSGHKGFKRREVPGPAGAAGAAGRGRQRQARASGGKGRLAGSRRSREEEEEEWELLTDEDDEEYTPSAAAAAAYKRRRRGGAFGLGSVQGPQLGRRQHLHQAVGLALAASGDEEEEEEQGGGEQRCDGLLSLLSLLGDAAEAEGQAGHGEAVQCAAAQAAREAEAAAAAGAVQHLAQRPAAMR